jgi:hypothetical protein
MREEQQRKTKEAKLNEGLPPGALDNNFLSQLDPSLQSMYSTYRVDSTNIKAGS